MDKLKISNFEKVELKNSKYVKPVRINFTQNSIDKSWEAVESHESVAILLYHKSKESFLLVKQFRAPVYMMNKNYTYTYELCAGIVDKDLSVQEIAKEEILEECGYDIDITNIKYITSFFTNVGISGAKQYLFYAQIDDSCKISQAGGIHDEQIVLEYIHQNNAKLFLYDETKAKTPGLMFAFYWFFENEIQNKKG